MASWKKRIDACAYPCGYGEFRGCRGSIFGELLPSFQAALYRLTALGVRKGTGRRFTNMLDFQTYGWFIRSLFKK